MATREHPETKIKVTTYSRRKPRRPAGYRWLSIALPQNVFNNLHIQARLSDLSFQEYMARFCEEAFPLPGPIATPGKAPGREPSLNAGTGRNVEPHR